MIMRDAAAAPAPTRRRLRPRQMLLAAAGLAALGGAAWFAQDWWTRGRFVETTDDAYVGGDVTAIAPHVAGFVEAVEVADNQHVAAGQLLLRLDARDFTAALDLARASLTEKQSDAAGLEAQLALQAAAIRQADAELHSAQARDTFAREESDRYAVLADTVAGSRQQAQRTASARDDADAAVIAAQAKRTAALAQLDVLRRRLAGARAAVAEAAASERLATLNLGYTEIRSPIDGYVANRAARAGAYAGVGSYLLSIVPAHALWVDANFKEDQLAHLRPGQRATVIADAAPGRRIEGRVESLS
ncbi:MAG: HlyD family secretion protein, partial [Proteobacteria bacterium]|nr:HlyD family secretion protein [Pseudomonadota bacterium]